jgi:type I restriction enzyme R subunit
MAEAGYSPAEMAAIDRETTFYTDVRAAIKRHSDEEMDIKPFEGDMRHLINTYIKADPADPLGEVDKYSLVELIVQTGIHDAIAQKLNQSGKLSRNAVAEGIINNVRKTIIREQLTDPRFYEEMSKLLDDLIQQKRESAEEYEQFLKKTEFVAQQLVNKQHRSDVPFELQGKTEAIIIYNNLPGIISKLNQPIGVSDPQSPYGDEMLRLALEIDRAMREKAPAGWRGDDTREKQVQNALFPLMKRDRPATMALFELIKNMRGYE